MGGWTNEPFRIDVRVPKIRRTYFTYQPTSWRRTSYILPRDGKTDTSHFSFRDISCSSNVAFRDCWTKNMNTLSQWTDKSLHSLTLYFYWGNAFFLGSYFSCVSLFDSVLSVSFIGLMVHYQRLFDQMMRWTSIFIISMNTKETLFSSLKCIQCDCMLFECRLNEFYLTYLCVVCVFPVE